jgi:hypothetical protein
LKIKNSKTQLGNGVGFSIQAVSQAQAEKIHTVVGQFDVCIADVAVGEIQAHTLLGI